MKSPKLKLLTIVCCSLFASFLLVALGIQIGSDWSTFIPDLVIGVAGAIAIGFVLVASQESAERRRHDEADVGIAYNRLLDALTPLRTIDLVRGDASHVSVVRTRLMQLIEAVDVGKHGDTPFALWLDAEGRYCLNRALASLEAAGLLPGNVRASPAALLEASAPFHNWVGEFTRNIRYWRTGSLTVEMMIEQTKALEGLLSRGEEETSEPKRSVEPI